MYGVGKVDRGGALRQFNHRSFRRQHINAVVKQTISLRLVLCGARQVALPGQQLAQHGDFGVVFAVG